MNFEIATDSTARHFQVVRRPNNCRGGHRLAGWFVAFVVSLFTVISSPAQNRVLELDGDGSYVELPNNIFQNLTEATVEVWAK